jgi:hypothetical protein
MTQFSSQKLVWRFLAFIHFRMKFSFALLARGKYFPPSIECVATWVESPKQKVSFGEQPTFWITVYPIFEVLVIHVGLPDTSGS